MNDAEYLTVSFEGTVAYADEDGVRREIVKKSVSFPRSGVHRSELEMVWREFMRALGFQIEYGE